MKRSKIRQGIEKEINEKYYYYEGIVGRFRTFIDMISWQEYIEIKGNIKRKISMGEAQK